MILIIGFGPEVGALSLINPNLTLPETVMFVLVVISLVLTFVAFASYIPDAVRQILGKEKPEEKAKD